MNIKLSGAAIAAIVIASQSANAGGLGSLYVTNASGQLYQVDGDTLQATQIVQLQDAGTINEIEYIGNGQIVANLTFAVAMYDLNTNTQSTLFTAPDVYNNPGGFQYLGGLAQLDNGELYMSTHSATPNNFIYSAHSYNLQNNSFTEYADAPENLPFDHHQMIDGSMLTISGSDLYLHDLNSGAIKNSYRIGFFGVSFFETGGQIYLLSDDAEIYSLDTSDGSTSLYGTISGISGSTIGATIPAPSALGVFGMGALLSTKRRR